MRRSKYDHSSANMAIEGIDRKSLIINLIYNITPPTIEWLHVTSSVCVAAIWAIYICKQWLCFIISLLNSKNGELLPSFGLP